MKLQPKTLRDVLKSETTEADLDAIVLPRNQFIQLLEQVSKLSKRRALVVVKRG